MVVCFVKSGLPVTFKWTKDGLPLASKNSIHVYENVLVITVTRKEEFGIFTCTASNDAGTTSFNITVAPAETPVFIDGKENFLFFILFYFFFIVLITNLILKTLVIKINAKRESTFRFLL